MVEWFVAVSANTNDPWRVRLMAGIVAERATRGKELAQLLETDWTKDPEYDKRWEQNRAGPWRKMGPLVTKRFREKGLYWYYTELSWKETGEYCRGPGLWQGKDVSWRGCAWQATTNTPAFPLLVEVLAERIRNDIGFTQYERWGEYDFLLNSNTNTVLPHLLDIIARAPLNNRNAAWRKLATIAQPEDAPLIEKHFKDKGQDVPVPLREPLRKLNERLKNASELR